MLSTRHLGPKKHSTERLSPTARLQCTAAISTAPNASPARSPHSSEPTETFVFRATEALGGGMGGFTETCGAISGGEVIIGLACSNGSDNPTSKQDTYAWAHKLVDNFRARVGSTICEEIKNIEGEAPLRGCDLCILDSLEMTIDILIQIGKEA